MPFREPTTRPLTTLLRYSLHKAVAKATRSLVVGAVIFAFAVLYWMADRGALECRTASVGYDCTVTRAFGPVAMGQDEYDGVCTIGIEWLGTGRGRHEAVLLYPCAGGLGLEVSDLANTDELQRLADQVRNAEAGGLQEARLSPPFWMCFFFFFVGLTLLYVAAVDLRGAQGIFVLEVDAAETAISLRREGSFGTAIAPKNAALTGALEVERVEHRGRHGSSYSVVLVAGSERLELSPRMDAEEAATLETAVQGAIARLRAPKPS